MIFLVFGLFGIYDVEVVDIDVVVVVNRNCSIELIVFEKLIVWFCVEVIVGGEVRNE